MRLQFWVNFVQLCATITEFYATSSPPKIFQNNGWKVGCIQPLEMGLRVVRGVIILGSFCATLCS